MRKCVFEGFSNRSFFLHLYLHWCNCLVTQRWGMKKDFHSQQLHACVICTLVRLKLRWQNSLLQSCDSCVILRVPLQSLGRRAYVIFIVGYFCRLMVADKSRVKQIRNSIYCWDTWVNQQETQKKIDRHTHPKRHTHISLTVAHTQKTQKHTRQTDKRISLMLARLLFVYPCNDTTERQYVLAGTQKTLVR